MILKEKNTVDRQHYYSENEEQVNTYSYDAQFFENFEQLLQSADGGLKSVKSAKQNRYQAETIASVIGAATPLGIFQKKSVQERFLCGYAKEKRFMPGTTKSYLASLIHL